MVYTDFSVPVLCVTFKCRECGKKKVRKFY